MQMVSWHPVQTADHARHNRAGPTIDNSTAVYVLYTHVAYGLNKIAHVLNKIAYGLNKTAHGLNKI